MLHPLLNFSADCEIWTIYIHEATQSKNLKYHIRELTWLNKFEKDCRPAENNCEWFKEKIFFGNLKSKPINVFLNNPDSMSCWLHLQVKRTLLFIDSTKDYKFRKTIKPHKKITCPKSNKLKQKIKYRFLLQKQ